MAELWLLLKLQRCIVGILKKNAMHVSVRVVFTLSTNDVSCTLLATPGFFESHQEHINTYLV